MRNNGAPTWVFGEPDENADETSLLHLVRTVCFYRAGALRAEREGAIVLRAGADAYPPRAGLLAAVRYGEGRVVVTADSDLFGDDALGVLDHQRLWLNCLYWVALPAFRAEPEADRVGGGRRPGLGAPARRDRRAARVAGAQGRGRPRRATTRAEVGARVAAMTAADRRAGPPLPPPARLPRPGRARPAPLGSTRAVGKPDFGPSLALFRPELSSARRHRAPGRVPHVHAQRLARHALRGAHRAHPVARVHRPPRARRLRQRQVRAGAARRPHGAATTASAPCCSPRR